MVLMLWRIRILKLSEATSLRAGIWKNGATKRGLSTLGRYDCTLYNHQERITTVPEILLHHIRNVRPQPLSPSAFKLRGTVQGRRNQGRSRCALSGRRENISALLDVMQARGRITRTVLGIHFLSLVLLHS
ncbi:hypothetical protein ARMSODRAFT_156242 [Armillaria solidipes]|uniref:Uncharacterized protein n=1 Tax=Armillaria solidipes TaxID=1076256 RepID=A0A2H3BTC2_9AGAR|nr:hypothetical protein ARMSODRAFT_156242 [Armillaria solidipes]